MFVLLFVQEMMERLQCQIHYDVRAPVHPMHVIRGEDVIGFRGDMNITAHIITIISVLVTACVCVSP